MVVEYVGCVSVYVICSFIIYNIILIHFQLQNLEDNGDNNRAWDMIRGNIKILAKESIAHCELKHKLWFDKCPALVV
jgi:hypothetical protein